MSVSGPPIRKPAVPPIPPREPQMPSALLRSAPSSKVVITIESAVGVMIAAPAPWMARAEISAAGLQASAHNSDAAVKSPSPTMNTRLRPSRSAARPPSKSKPPKVRA
jgi:hypothetical protein